MHEGRLIMHISKNECADLSNPKLTMNLTGVDLSDADLSGADDFWTWYGDFKSSGGDTQLRIALVPPVFNHTEEFLILLARGANLTFIDSWILYSPEEAPFLYSPLPLPLLPPGAALPPLPPAPPPPPPLPPRQHPPSPPPARTAATAFASASAAGAKPIITTF